MSKTSIVIIDDHEEFLDVIHDFINTFPDYQVEESFNTASAFVKKRHTLTSQLFLIDIEIPQINGIELAELIIKYNFDAQCIAITAYEDKVYLESLVFAGFKAFVKKQKVAEDLHNTIQKVLKGEFIFPPEIKLNNISSV